MSLSYPNPSTKDTTIILDSKGLKKKAHIFSECFKHINHHIILHYIKSKHFEKSI